MGLPCDDVSPEKTEVVLREPKEPAKPGNFTLPEFPAHLKRQRDLSRFVMHKLAPYRQKLTSYIKEYVNYQKKLADYKQYRKLNPESKSENTPGEVKTEPADKSDTG